MTQNILLFSIGTTTWGVGDQDITAVTAARPLHRLPLSPPSVAGMALIDEKAVTVFDLGACLGAPPLAEPHKGSFLLITRDDRTTAFAVAGKVDRMDSGADAIVPLPGPARSTVVESCLIRGSSLIPIIKMQNLLDRVKQGDLDVPSPLAAAAEKQGAATPSSVLVFALSDEKFCIDAAGARYGEGHRGSITTLPYARQLAGIMRQELDVVPIMSLSGRIGLDRGHDGPGMIITEIDGQRWGLPVEQEEGRRENVTVLELPAVARPSWSRGAIVENSEVIPLVDLSSAGSGLPDSKDENYLAEQYHPASAFPGHFRKGSVEVIELSLFGTCHAVPKDEVAEVLPLLPFRRMTQVPEIVLGVAEVKGRLLPVLDLEAIFGRRSRVTEEWKMLRIANGDFEALVVIETVLGGRELPQDMQRQVPIAIPHQVLYGCYLDASAVRLILNVEALAVHFEKTEIREFIAGMSPEIPMVLSEPKKEDLQAPSMVEASEVQTTVQSPVPEQPTPAEMHVSGDSHEHTGTGGGSGWRAPRIDEEAAVKAKEAAAEQDRKRAEKEEIERTEREARERAEAEARVKAEEESRLRAAEEERLRREAEARQRAEQEVRERAEAEARVRAENEARQKAAEEERKRSEDAERQRAAEIAREQEAARARAQTEEEARRREAEEVRKQTQAAAEARQRAEERLREVIAEELRGRSGAGLGKAAPAAGASSSEQGVHWKWPVAAALAVVAIIALLLYLTGKAPEEAGKAAVTMKHDVPPIAVPAPAKVEPKAEVRKEPEPPLYLKVPAAMPKPETVVYVVVKGDTLWGIAKRFTGNPFNYPRVARDNSIATPDLIFPGQKIKLIQEKK